MLNLRREKMDDIQYKKLAEKESKLAKKAKVRTPA